MCLESIVHDTDDSRPFAKITLAGMKCEGLLDSGANISALGAGYSKFLNNDTKINSFRSVVHTANGTPNRIIGYVHLNVEFNGRNQSHKFLLVPSLTLDVYLGIDFFKAFGVQVMTIDGIALEPTPPSTDSSIDQYDFHSLTPQQRTILDQIISKFPSYAKEGLGRTHLLQHEIKVTDPTPIKQRHYAVSPAVEAEIYAELDRMIQLDVIEESSSPWCSPMAIVRKKNGKARLCLDARKINSITVKDAYPLPLIEGLLSRLENTQYITALDLKDAFWQVPLDSKAKEITAFAVPGRPLYQFKVMPFGLCNSPQTLCRLMHRVIPYQWHDRVFVYLDDLLITSPNYDEHLELLKMVAKQLREAGLTINVEKSRFCLKEVEYLGYIVGGGSLRVNPDKLAAIVDYPQPKTARQIRRFLGMTGWYRRFISDYATLSAPLTDLLKKNTKIVWSPESEAAFKALKEALVSAPVLVHPNYKKMFYIRCDASTYGIGGVLYQLDESGEERPICFFSHKLNGAQKKYSITELECLAVVLSVQKFRPYIERHPFTVMTDHASLKWLMNQRDLSGRLARWSLKLQGYNLEIEHCKGTSNVVPDALSRLDIDALEVQERVGDTSISVDWNDEGFQDPVYVQQCLDVLNREKELGSFLRVIDGKMFVKTHDDDDSYMNGWRLVIPNSMTRKLLELAHVPPTSAHMGVSKTIDLLRRFFHWGNLAKDVEDFVKNCEICKTSKAPNQQLRPPMGDHVDVKRPFQWIYLDFLGPYPRSRRQNKYILVLVDKFTKFVLCRAVKDATAQSVVTLLKSTFHMFGVPETVFTDNGKQFTSKIVQQTLKDFGVLHMFTPKYSPQSNASERVNRTILNAIRSYVNESHQTWDEHLEEISSAMRNTKHDTIKCTPFFSLFGQHYVPHGSFHRLLESVDFVDENFLKLEEPSDKVMGTRQRIRQYLREAYLKNQTRYNLRSRKRKVEVGDKVYIRNFVQSSAVDKFNAKLARKFVPAIISKAVGNTAFEVTDLKGVTLGVYHLKDIKQ